MPKIHVKASPLYLLRVVAYKLAGLEHATIRDNIIFGAAFGFDEARYQAVIEACALIHDLAIFDAGDMTGKFPRLCSQEYFTGFQRLESVVSPFRVDREHALHWRAVSTPRPRFGLLSFH